MAGYKRSASDLGPEFDAYGDIHGRSDNPQVIRRHHLRLPDHSKLLPSPSSHLHPTSPSGRNPPFNIYKALIRHPNLFFQLALRLSEETMLDLYAIDKEFHFRFNQYGVSLILDYARYHAPVASYIFSWSLYPSMCISDPMLKPMDNRAHLSRDIPSLRWTKMVLFRDAVVREILTLLALDGHRVPRATAASLLKFWHIMGMNRSAPRAAFIRNPKMLSDQDIILFQLLLTKLDMRFADPVQAQGVCDFSHLLLSQKSLTALRDVLSGKIVMDYDKSTDMARKTFQTHEFDMDEVPWIDDETENGVPEHEWALMSQEGWSEDGAMMPYAVDMVIEEGIRRGLHVQRHYLDFLTYGYVNMATGRNVENVRKYRGRRGVVETEGWPKEKEITELVDRLDKRCGLGKGGPTVSMGTMNIRLVYAGIK